MVWTKWKATCLMLAVVPSAVYSSTRDEQKRAADFVRMAEGRLEVEAVKSRFAAWDYGSNIRDEAKAKKLEAQERYDRLSQELGREAKKFDREKIEDVDVLRKLDLLSRVGTAVLPEDKLVKFNKLVSDMVETYSTAKVEGFRNKGKLKSLEPELTLIMAQSRDPEELEYYWESWREVSGKKMGQMYKSYVAYSNEAARLNGFPDASLMKVHPYESDAFIEEVENTWQGLEPLYRQLHAYVRRKLHDHYGPKVVPNEGPIPAHLLGNMWAQSWNNIADILKPFPGKPSINVTGAMVRRGWTPPVMFRKADDFFQSMGMEPMPDSFWTDSILEKPDDGRELTCHASAWDFFNGVDYRIKQCTRVNQEDFVTANHEMGHLQYALQYRHLGYLYRTGANPGFHEGVADIVSLAVGTATYFQRLGLLPASVDVADEDTDINILFDMALERIAFLPFGYLVDKFRWDVYRGLASLENMNCHWWRLRHEIQGVSPPSRRSHLQFDPGAKFHVAVGSGYVKYFVAYIYEFQFYRALCLASGAYAPGDPARPLHRCNFYGSRAAGDKLKEMLKLGASKPWKEAMRVMTGRPEMSTEAIREYFKPLENWLAVENRKHGVEVGWGVVDVERLCEEPPGNGKRMGHDSKSGAAGGAATAGLMATLVNLLLVV